MEGTGQHYPFGTIQALCLQLTKKVAYEALMWPAKVRTFILILTFLYIKMAYNSKNACDLQYPLVRYAILVITIQTY